MSDLIERLIAGDEDHLKAAEAINSMIMVSVTQQAEIARLRLDLAAQECLQDSTYKAGLKAGRQLCEDGDSDGYHKAMSSGEHLAELRRINEERANLERQDHDHNRRRIMG